MEEKVCWVCSKRLRSYEIQKNKEMGTDEMEWYCDECNPYDDDEGDLY